MQRRERLEGSYGATDQELAAASMPSLGTETDPSFMAEPSRWNDVMWFAQSSAAIRGCDLPVLLENFKIFLTWSADTFPPKYSRNETLSWLCPSPCNFRSGFVSPFRFWFGLGVWLNIFQHFRRKIQNNTFLKKSFRIQFMFGFVSIL